MYIYYPSIHQFRESKHKSEKKKKKRKEKKQKFLEDLENNTKQRDSEGKK